MKLSTTWFVALRRWHLLAAVLLLLPVLVATAAPVQPVEGRELSYAQDTVLVAFREQVPLAARLNTLARLDVAVDPAVKSDYFARLRIGPQARAAGLGVEGMIARLRQDPAVRVAEPDYLVHSDALPNDASFNQLWGLHNTGQSGGTVDADIDAPEAWDTTTGSSTVVAVIDTGVDYNHPDLSANILRNAGNQVVGFDYLNNDADPMDDNDHGTHCAGIIGAVGNNGIGVAGVCWNVKIMPLKFLPASGGGPTSAAIQCIDFARTNGARIMSNSWGGTLSDQLLIEAIQRARSAGILFVAAAGNGGEDQVGDNNGLRPLYPASYNAVTDNVIAVAATDRSDALSGLSNYGGTTVEIAAPGTAILSTTRNNTYTLLSGTSMAAPHVAGAAALILSRHPGLTYTQLKSRLLYNVDYPLALAGKVISGRLNVNRPLENDTIAPGAPTSLAASHTAASALRHAWTAAGDDGASGAASEYELRYSASPITPANFSAAARVPSAPRPGPAGTTESCLLAGLADAATYHVAVRALDNVGNASSLIAAGPFSTLPLTTLMSDNVEGALRFSGPAPWGTTTAQSFSPNRSYTDSPAGDYMSNVDSSLTLSTPVTLTGSNPLLSFQARTSLQDGFDFLYVEASADGATWVALTRLSGTTGWTRYALPLALFGGAPVQVRFRLQTDVFGVMDGVYLDDIRLASNPDNSTPVLADNVEGGPRFAGQAPWGVVTQSATEFVFSPTQSYTDSPGDNHGASQDLSLTQITPVALSGFVPVLTFMARTELNNGFGSADAVYPEVSNDGGTTWRRPGLALTGFTAWTHYTVPLAAYAGQSVLVRFRLISGLFRGGRPGVWLDDIRIAGDALRSLAPASTILSPSTLSVSVGGALSVSFTAPAGRPANDWIGLFKAGDPNTAAQAWWKTTGGATSGTFDVLTPAAPGSYEFRYFQDGNRTSLMATSDPVTVTLPGAGGSPDYTLTPSAGSVPAGGALSIGWTAPPVRSGNDWIDLVKAGDPVTGARSWWSFTSGVAAGSLSLTAPREPGSYEFCYLLSGGTTEVRRAPLTVTAPTGAGYTLTPSSATLVGGSEAAINWTAPAGASQSDWIVLCKVGEPNTAYRWWDFTGGASSGARSLTVPTEPGQYEFRYLLGYSFTDVKRSAITITAPAASSYTLTPSVSSTTTGGALSISWTAPGGSSGVDWIVLCKVGEPNTAYRWWDFTGGATSGSRTLTAPMEPGQYEFRYLLNYGFTDVKRSSTVTLTIPTGHSLTPSATSVTAGGPLSISWTAPARSSAIDWIGLLGWGTPIPPTAGGTTPTGPPPAPTT